MLETGKVSQKGKIKNNLKMKDMFRVRDLLLKYCHPTLVPGYCEFDHGWDDETVALKYMQDNPGVVVTQWNVKTIRTEAIGILKPMPKVKDRAPPLKTRIDALVAHISDLEARIAGLERWANKRHKDPYIIVKRDFHDENKE